MSREGTPNDSVYLKKLKRSFVCPLCYPEFDPRKVKQEVGKRGQYKKHYSTLWKLRLHFAFHHSTQKIECTRYIEDYQIKIELGKLR